MAKHPPWHRLCRLIIYVLLGLSAGGTAQADPTTADWVAVISATQEPQISGFASAQPNGLITIAPSQTGIISGLDVLPGQSVATGQVVAMLGGPQITAGIVQALAALTNARAAQRAADISLTTEQQKLQQHLSTRQLVAQAGAALTAATGQVASAAATLAALRQSAILRSPLAGVVQTVAVADGDVLAVGQTIATIQPSAGSWLKAVLYNTSAADLPPGTIGLFVPGTGGTPVPVSVRGAFGAAQADGGMPVALAPAHPLAPGTFGTVTLDLPKQTVTMVPTDALILDKGQWWVMQHTAQGDYPLAVVPGPAQGYDTVINSGVKPGDEVVVVNAYLLYHRGIAALYQPPD